MKSDARDGVGIAFSAHACVGENVCMRGIEAMKENKVDNKIILICL